MYLGFRKIIHQTMLIKICAMWNVLRLDKSSPLSTYTCGEYVLIIINLLKMIHRITEIMNYIEHKLIKIWETGYN